MEIEPFLIASTVRAVVGQRLVRRLCVDCREEVAPDAATLKQIGEIFGLDDSGVMKRVHQLEEQALEGGIGKANAGKAKVDTTKLSTTDSKITRLFKVHDGGCESCGHIGYRGRMGIYEVLDNSSEIQQLIIANGTSEQIQQQAIKDGMVTMQFDGFIKALRGQTTMEEILRVTAEE
jgi:type II secretory ATPase GspE/PulE/Tfp pilus assembly ATPase PilB-like protein